MAKDSPNAKPKTETPFQRFQALVRKIANVPKSRIQKKPRAES